LLANGSCAGTPLEGPGESAAEGGGAEVPFDSAVRNGLVATDSAVVRADVGIRDGKIDAVAPRLAEPAELELDATSQYVVPGAIDVHTHFATVMGDLGMTADDYQSGTRAAAAGGVTTIINYAFQEPGRSLSDAVERETALARRQAHVDYGFHPVIVDLTATPDLRELQDLVAAGFTSVKIFTSVDGYRLTDREILHVLAAARDSEALVTVHADDDGLVCYLQDRRRAAGAPPDRAAEDFRLCHPPEAEALAVEHVAAYARIVGWPVYFVHLSSAAGMGALRRARAAGTQAFGETRPAYLFLDESRYSLPGREPAKYVCIPPLRSLRDQEVLWAALSDGSIQTIASDHTSWMARQKMDPARTFADIPAGFPSVQTWPGMLFSEGVAKERLTLQQFVRLSSANPARLFGLWPRKGTIAVGSDADLTVIDPELNVVLSPDWLQSSADYDPYAGYASRGWPRLTLARGELVYADGEIRSRPGRGRLLRRQPAMTRLPG
jgi:dihydropyrimidinase